MTRVLVMAASTHAAVSVVHVLAAAQTRWSIPTLHRGCWHGRRLGRGSVRTTAKPPPGSTPKPPRHDTHSLAVATLPPSASCLAKALYVRWFPVPAIWWLLRPCVPAKRRRLPVPVSRVNTGAAAVAAAGAQWWVAACSCPWRCVRRSYSATVAPSTSSEGSSTEPYATAEIWGRRATGQSARRVQRWMTLLATAGGW